MYISVNTANRIKSLAKQKNIAIKDLLDGCGLNKNTLSSMKSRGSWIQANNLAKIADYLGCSVDYLLGRTNNPDINKWSTLCFICNIKGNKDNTIIILFFRIVNSIILCNILPGSYTHLDVYKRQPGTLPSNLALCVNKSYEYAEVKANIGTDDEPVYENYILAKDLIETVLEETPSDVVKTFKGEELLGIKYDRLMQDVYKRQF